MKDISRKRILAWWVFTQSILMLLSALIGLLLWQATAGDDPTGWQPINDFNDIMGSLITFGWLISIIWPTTWISLICLGIGLWRRSYKPLYVAGVCAVIYGLFWPNWFTGIMGI